MLPLHQSPMAEQQLRGICLVRDRRLELLRMFQHLGLNQAPMPIRVIPRIISAPGGTRTLMLAHWYLKPACLPIPPQELIYRQG